MNKDLEKIIHETAREIAKVLAGKVEPYDQKIDATLKSIAKMSASMAIELHAETQKLIDESKPKAVLTVGGMVTAKDVGLYGKIESITSSGILVSFGGIIESKLYSGDDVNFIM